MGAKAQFRGLSLGGEPTNSAHLKGVNVEGKKTLGLPTSTFSGAASDCYSAPKINNHSGRQLQAQVLDRNPFILPNSGVANGARQIICFRKKKAPSRPPEPEKNVHGVLT